MPSRKNVHSKNTWTAYEKQLARTQLHLFLVSSFAGSCGTIMRQKHRPVFTHLYQGRDVCFGFFSISGKTIVPCKAVFSDGMICYERCEPDDVVDVFSEQHSFKEWPGFLEDVLEDITELVTPFCN